MRRAERLGQIAEFKMRVAVDQPGKQGNLTQIDRSGMRPVVNVDDQAVRNLDDSPSTGGPAIGQTRRACRLQVRGELKCRTR